MHSFTCGWCGMHYTKWQNRCDSCGGPMPSLPGTQLGAPPPPAPRPLPNGFAFRLLWSGNVLVIIGAMFAFIGGLLFLPMLFIIPIAALLPLFFVLLGLIFFIIGRRGAKKTLDAFLRGTAVAGHVVDVSIDYSQSVNSQHPWKLRYHFNVDGTLHEGSAVSYDSTVATRTAGQPLWVLYVPENPAQSTLYPPLK